MSTPDTDPAWALLRPFRDHPDTAVVATDFDGTLSPVVPDPGAARPLPGVPEVLTALHGHYALVAVISGRPLAFLRQVLPPGITAMGLYGLEWSAGGDSGTEPGADAWAPVVEATAQDAQAALPPGVGVERKGLSLTLHYRNLPDAAGDVLAWATTAAADAGLEVRPARMSVELHPPVPVDKGTALERLAAPMRSACFLGDDAGDLPAFDALDRLAARGVHTVRIGVRSPEAPAEIIRRADIVVDGPKGSLALLQSLLP